MGSRRQFLALAGSAAVVGLAGCAEHEAEFLVTDVQSTAMERDIRYRLSIENSGPSREEGTLELTLTYDTDGESETWSKTDDLSLARGSSVQEEYWFEDVLTDGRELADFDLDTDINQNDD